MPVINSNVSEKDKGLEYLKDKRIGLDENQQGDVRFLINKWLHASEKGVIHAQDPERGPRNLERIKKFFHSKFVPTNESFPVKEFIRVQNEASLAQGRGRVADQLSKEQLSIRIDSEIQNIRDSLDSWVEYFTSPDSSSFPIWAKYWSFLGVLKMSGKMKIDPETQEVSFPKREKNTIAGFPELNREALALAVEHIVRLVEKGQKLDEALKKESFRDVYAFYINKLRGEGTGGRELSITEGTWVKYSKGDDPVTINALVDSLQGKNTGWCTASRSTAESQLKTGDFYVYYSKSVRTPNRPNPRIAIRMSGSIIEEVRGIGYRQGFDSEIEKTDILESKLKEFGNAGKEYIKKSENMKKLSEIHNSLKEGPAEFLTDDEIKFLYSSPEGFGYTEDPRIQEIISYETLRKRHNFKNMNEETIKNFTPANDLSDLLSSLVFVNPDLHFKLVSRLFDLGYASFVIDNFDKFTFTTINNFELVNKLIDIGYDQFLIENLDKFPGVSVTQIANKLIEVGLINNLAVAINYRKISGLDNDIAIKLIDEGYTYTLMLRFDSFNGLNNEFVSKFLDKAYDNEIDFLINMIWELKFPKLDSQIAIKLIEKGKAKYVVHMLNRFNKLNSQVAALLLSSGYISKETLANNKESFIEIDELLKSD